ncbi:MAG: 50S ribosomal protein L6 [Chlamydiae bacterium]|nr:50S ribosomal protein L6 [Chlamydiota bacterium]
MSKLAKKPLIISSKHKVTQTGSLLTIQGTKGTLKREVNSQVQVVINGQELSVLPADDSSERKFLGTEFALIRNALMGVEKGFEKKLQLVGVGFKAAVAGKTLDLALGFSHPVKVEIPEGITVTVEKQTLITISGIDKQKVGHFAATVRQFKKPEPYKGKGIRYEGEHIKLKAGKSASKK